MARCGKGRARAGAGINTKLMAAFLAAWVIPVTLIVLFLCYGFYAQLIEREEQAASVSAELAVQRLQGHMDRMEGIITSLMLNYNVNEILGSDAQPLSYEWFTDIKRMGHLLESLSAQSGEEYIITVVGENHKRFTHGSSLNFDLNMSSPLVRDIVSSEGYALINRVEGSSGGVNVITMGKAVKKGGRIIGAVIVDLMLDSIDAVFANYGPPEYVVLLTDSGGSVVYDKGLPQGLRDGAGALMEKIGGGERSVLLDGGRYLAVAATEGTRNMRAAILADEAWLFRDSRRLILQFSLAFLAVMLAGAAAVTVLSRRISRGLKELNGAAKEFGRSGRPVPLTPATRDEVGQLTEEFSALTHRVGDLLEQTRRDERQKRVMELKALQAQVNPHMIYNTLNTITNLAQIHGVTPIERVSSSFAELLRSISKNEASFVTLEEEMNFLDAYITLKKFNLLWNLTLERDLEPGTERAPVMKLLLQPLVENSVIHGLSGVERDGVIRVTARLAGDDMELFLEDNGSGIEPDTVRRLLDGTYRSEESLINVGVRNTVERLRAQYGENCFFGIESEPGRGTRIILRFPRGDVRGAGSM